MSDGAPIVYVVDDDPSVLRGLQRLLRSAGLACESFASPVEFLARHDRDAVGCVVLDLSMPELDGLGIQQALNDLHSALAIVFLTGHGDIASSVRAMKGGAVDFLTKPVGDDELLAAVRIAIERCAAQRRSRHEVEEVERRLATLTPREREVLAHLISGRLNKQIAADLGTVEQTVKVHRARIMQKMQVRSLAALVRLAGRIGIDPAPIARP